MADRIFSHRDGDSMDAEEEKIEHVEQDHAEASAAETTIPAMAPIYRGEEEFSGAPVETVAEPDELETEEAEETLPAVEDLAPEIEEALEKGTIICYLLSDAAQIELWPTVKKHLTKGKALYFSHGFGITFKEQTGIVPPPDVDVFLVAPKGSGTSLRRMFLQGRGLNSSYAIFQDATGRAKERVVALGIAVGSGYLFETNFKKEVYSDLTGERGTLMGAIQGIFAAQYQVLRDRGHSPSEAFNETVEELTQSLMPLVAENGMDWMYANCSTTAQRGALDWWKKFRDATLPVFTELYESVAAGKESQRSIDSNSQADYREKLDAELKELRDSEMWQAGKTVRSLRPENQPAKSGKKAEAIS